jgi:hypothetical protein
MASSHIAVIVFQFPNYVSEQDIRKIFTSNGVYDFSVKGTDISRVLPKRGTRTVEKKLGGETYVTAKIKYPHPLIDIQKDIQKKFGKKAVKEKNLTNIDDLLNTGLSKVKISENVSLDLKSVNVNNANLDELEKLFGETSINGGAKRRTTRKHNKSKKTTRKH